VLFICAIPAGAALTGTVVPPSNAAVAAAIIQYVRIVAIPFCGVHYRVRVERAVAET
jgi:hypothetical protein